MTKSDYYWLILGGTFFVACLSHKIGMLLVGIVDDIGWKETHFRKLVLLLVRLVVCVIIFCGCAITHGVYTGWLR